MRGTAECPLTTPAQPAWSASRLRLPDTSIVPTAGVAQLVPGVELLTLTLTPPLPPVPLAPGAWTVIVCVPSGSAVVSTPADQLDVPAASIGGPLSTDTCTRVTPAPPVVVPETVAVPRTVASVAGWAIKITGGSGASVAMACQVAADWPPIGNCQLFEQSVPVTHEYSHSMKSGKFLAR